jgi:hypothetical protein
MATREQLAENTGMYLLPRPSYGTVVTDDWAAFDDGRPVGEVRLFADRL